ncbi:homeodomain transcription factor [Phlebopus sp. FC_14]|nr:homeodomain transcription factor [Phlebopus sp. FC_14]
MDQFHSSPPRFQSPSAPSHSSRDLVHIDDPPPLKAALDDEKLHNKSDKTQDSPDIVDKPTTKKPRHRHSPAQLAALNELFDKNEHPSLDERSELAEKLGMETKTVNAWFQNKRASTKKRNKGAPSDPSSATSPLEPPEKNPKASPPSNLPSIANLLNTTPPSLPLTQPPPSQPSRSRSHATSRRSKQKDLHLNDRLLAEPSTSHTQNSLPEGALESSFFAGPPEFFSIQDRFINHNRARGESSRMRTSPQQAEELRRAYVTNAHPTREQRQELAERIGMRLQSVTNWFQNQRSQARKHKEESLSSSGDVPAQLPPPPVDNGSTSPPLAHPHDLFSRTHRPPLVIPDHEVPPLPTLQLSPPNGEDHELVPPRSRMSLPPSFHPRMSSPRVRRSMTPYARDQRDPHLDEGRRLHDNNNEGFGAEDPLARPRRSRPEPHQLNALKKLLHRTSTPSIEERSALALEVGMDIGKVTNWFRNIRQTARKRAKRAGAGSRSRGTRPFEHDASSGSSVFGDDDAMDLDYEDIIDQEMDERSEDEFQEAVTPSSGISPSPPPTKRSRPHLPVHHGMGHMGTESMGIGLIEPSAFQELEKATGMANAGGSSDYALGSGMTYSGVKIEDALLLLSFHQHVVH